MFLKPVTTMKINQFFKIKYKLFLFGFLFSIISNPVHAYAGPGVAIGAVIVFLTVIFAFFASTFISIFNIIKKLFHKFFNLIQNSKKKKIKKNRS